MIKVKINKILSIAFLFLIIVFSACREEELLYYLCIPLLYIQGYIGPMHDIENCCSFYIFVCGYSNIQKLRQFSFILY